MVILCASGCGAISNIYRSEIIFRLFTILKEANCMPLYMNQFAYTPEAWMALTKQPQDRSKPIGEVIQKLGGRLIGLYYSFGEYDGVVLYEAPEEISASAVMLAAISAGHLKASKTTRLLTVEEAMEAMRKAGDAILPAPSK
jgi:uncharacterized protein with GYD domain